MKPLCEPTLIIPTRAGCRGQRYKAEKWGELVSSASCWSNAVC